MEVMSAPFCVACGKALKPDHAFCSNCGTPVAAGPPPYLYVPTPPPRKDYTGLIVIGVVLLVVFMVVLPAVLYLLVSSLLVPPVPPGPPASIGVAVSLSMDGTSWILTFTYVPSSLSPSTTWLALYSASNSTWQFASDLSSLEGVGLSGVVYVPATSGNPYCAAGDRILIAAGTGTNEYPSGTQFHLTNNGGVLAAGILQ